MSGPGVQYLEVDCFLCEQPRLAKPKSGWVEVGDMGPHRRAHEKCFAEVAVQLRNIGWETENPLSTLEMIEERERARGIEPPARDPTVIAEMVRSFEAFKPKRAAFLNPRG